MSCTGAESGSAASLGKTCGDRRLHRARCFSLKEALLTRVFGSFVRRACNLTSKKIPICPRALVFMASLFALLTLSWSLSWLKPWSQLVWSGYGEARQSRYAGSKSVGGDSV